MEEADEQFFNNKRNFTTPDKKKIVQRMNSADKEKLEMLSSLVGQMNIEDITNANQEEAAEDS